jgi:hypothetical protein
MTVEFSTEAGAFAMSMQQTPACFTVTLNAVRLFKPVTEEIPRSFREHLTMFTGLQSLVVFITYIIDVVNHRDTANNDTSC